MRTWRRLRGDRINNLIGHHFFGHVDQHLDLVEAVERTLRRPVRVDVGKHVGRYRAELDDGRADRLTLEIGPQPGREMGEAGLGRGVRHEPREDSDAGERRDVTM